MSTTPEFLDFGDGRRFSSWADIRWEFQAWRSKRAVRKALERDLATYRTSAEVHELNAILSRYDDDEVAEIRHILDRRRPA